MLNSGTEVEISEEILAEELFQSTTEEQDAGGALHHDVEPNANEDEGDAIDEQLFTSWVNQLTNEAESETIFVEGSSEIFH